MERFRKSERLCSKKSIGLLFSSGNSLFHYPFRLVWKESDYESFYPIRLGITVPRKIVKKAVTRNRIKRLIRESYRINKKILYKNRLIQNRKFDIMLIYISGNVYDFNSINLKLQELIDKFIQNNASGQDMR